MEQNSESMLVHSERTAALCYATARELNLEPEELEIVYIAGLVHELGKIGLPTKIRLRDEFVDLNKIYPYFTATLLNNYEELESLNEVIMQHQENYDGSGFPNGLKGDEINLLAIILRIADFYDTQRLTGLTHDETTKLLRENSDIIFPRKIITPFIKSVIKNELQFEYDENKDNNDEE